MTPQSAYRLRRRAEGRSFALAWDAALYLARQRLIDEAIERAIDGNVDTYTKDGQVVGERRRKDSRFLLATITKLEESLFCNRATRAVAQEFDEFLDCMEGDANRDLAIDVVGGEGAVPCAGDAAAQFLAIRGNDEPIARQQLGQSHERLVRLGRYAAGLGQGLSEAALPPMEFNEKDIENWDKWEEEFRRERRQQP